MAKNKQLSAEEVKQEINGLSTQEQLEVLSYTQKLLDDKAQKAENELSLIKNNGK
jgi:hypothetical protein